MDHVTMDRVTSYCFMKKYVHEFIVLVIYYFYAENKWKSLEIQCAKCVRYFV